MTFRNLKLRASYCTVALYGKCTRHAFLVKIMGWGRNNLKGRIFTVWGKYVEPFQALQITVNI